MMKIIELCQFFWIVIFAVKWAIAEQQASTERLKRRWLILNNKHLPGFDARDFEGKTK